MYLTGPEISVDCSVDGGRVHLVNVARKRLGFTPHFEEVGHLAATSLLYGDEHRQAEALAADAPVRLPHIADQLVRTAGAFTKLTGRSVPVSDALEATR